MKTAGQPGTLQQHLLQRQCVACGYDGALLRDGAAARCARCGCDLRRRPARSYAEMEGMVVRAPQRRVPPPEKRSRDLQRPLLHRWLAFGFFAMGLLLLLLLVYLAVAAFAV